MFIQLLSAGAGEKVQPDWQRYFEKEAADWPVLALL